MTTRLIACLIGSVAAALVCGCSIKTTFPGRSTDQVWHAMVATAETPEYGPADHPMTWHVVTNDVITSPTTWSVSVHRIVERTIPHIGRPPTYQERLWNFEVALEDINPPTATFTVPDGALPAWVHEEATVFFDQVRSLLRSPPVRDTTPTRPEIEVLPAEG